MDINKYKIENSMYELRDSIKSKYDVSIKLSDEIGKHTKPIVQRKIKEFLDSFKNFFEGHGFKISSNQIGTLVASNEKAEFELELIDKEDQYAKFTFCLPKEHKYIDIFIKGNEDSKKFMSWKSNPGISRFKWDGFEITSDTTIEQLTKMDTAMDENIQWFQQTLSVKDQLEFVFCSDSDEVYQDFEDFFNKN